MKNILAFKKITGCLLAVTITVTGLGMLGDTNPNNDAIATMLTVGGAGFFGIQINSNSKINTLTDESEDS